MQEQVRSKKVSLVKVAGDSNPDDALTKYVDKGKLTKALDLMSMRKLDGRAASAPRAMGVEP